MDDPNFYVEDLPLEKRVYDDNGENICKATPHKPTMVIQFSDCTADQIQCAVTNLIEDGYRFKSLVDGHYGKKIATFDL